MAWRLCLSIMLMLALSACSRDRPSWFSRERKPPPTLVVPFTRLGTVPVLAGAPVLVVPTQGLPATVDGLPIRLATAIVDALVARDVLAATRSAGASTYLLQTAVEGDSLRARMVGPDGLAIIDKAVPLDAPVEQLDRAGLERLAAAVASAIVALPDGEATMAQGGTRVRVVGVEGAPGDGNRALALALERDLARRGLVVVDAEGPDILSIRGRVEVTRKETRDHVVLLWQVSAPGQDGVATIRQENDVPSGALDSKWGLIAPAAAEGGGDGITEAISAFAARGR
ncbi:hypothetical protein [Zavarzinia aquatilis]|uniref:Uncharacterized protein n=1 Tax=Zavarzinia aquatilis TaxID=2211142 RepID=A0A317E6Y8_9PROT|nr:hypothetical protein [Zavarzinia aquatilis]PWR22878.1 hypothetical protein DKG74_10685 [Zavarzinia aquatilis]